MYRRSIEGTGSYGVGISKYLTSCGYHVVEVVRPKRDKRRAGTDKNDLADAERAARDALAEKATGLPKAQCGWVEALRHYMVAREAAVKTSTMVANSVHALLVTAPENIRERFDKMTTPALMKALSRKQRATDELERAFWVSSHTLALMWKQAKDDADGLEGAMKNILRINAPALLDICCCGVVSAAQLAITAGDNPERLISESAFASLCGASPIEACSGKVKRYRLNRGGDRQANRSLHTIARLRMAKDSRAKRYVAKRTKDGKSRKEIERLLVRYIVREVYYAINHPMETNYCSFCETASLLKAKRLSFKETQSHAAQALGVASSRISELERCILQDSLLLQRYRDWLESASINRKS